MKRFRQDRKLFLGWHERTRLVDRFQGRIIITVHRTFVSGCEGPSIAYCVASQVVYGFSRVANPTILYLLTYVIRNQVEADRSKSTSKSMSGRFSWAA